VSPAPFSSPLAASLAEDVLTRFERYAAVDTQSRRTREGSPSSPGQLELGRMLVGELHDLGLTDAAIDDAGYVTATLAGTVDGAPVIGVIAHLDTSPDAPGEGVTPIVHRDYDGGAIALPHGGTVLDPAAMPELSRYAGHDLVTASGDTLLGADDKAGVAAIMAGIAHLAGDGAPPRATLRVAFTPDEEVGELAQGLDLKAFGARCAYTLDGSELGELTRESFAALDTVLTITGVEIHPGQAKGKLVNALRLAGRVLAALPADRLAPEAADGRDGFIHPYELMGHAGRAELRSIVRDFDEDRLAAHVALLERVAEEVVGPEPRASFDLTVHRQYRNMREFIERDPDVAAAAEEAIRAEGLEPIDVPIRGGTDGSSLSERGLPTPNLFTGWHEVHSVREWASVQEMAAAAATVVRLAEVWSRRR
jgi:tripeptide aminopeptidase